MNRTDGVLSYHVPSNNNERAGSSGSFLSNSNHGGSFGGYSSSTETIIVDNSNNSERLELNNRNQQHAAKNRDRFIRCEISSINEETKNKKEDTTKNSKQSVSSTKPISKAVLSPTASSKGKAALSPTSSSKGKAALSPTPSSKGKAKAILDFSVFNETLTDLLMARKDSNRSLFSTNSSSSKKIQDGPKRSCLKGSRAAAEMERSLSSTSSFGIRTSITRSRGGRNIKQQLIPSGIHFGASSTSNLNAKNSCQPKVTVHMIAPYENPSEIWWTQEELDSSLRGQLSAFKYGTKVMQIAIRDYLVYHKRTKDELANAMTKMKKSTAPTDGPVDTNVETIVKNMVQMIAYETRKGLWKGLNDSFDGLEQYVGTSPQLIDQHHRNTTKRTIQFYKYAKFKQEQLRTKEQPQATTSLSNTSVEEYVRNKYQEITAFDRNMAYITAAASIMMMNPEENSKSIAKQNSNCGNVKRNRTVAQSFLRKDLDHTTTMIINDGNDDCMDTTKNMPTSATTSTSSIDAVSVNENSISMIEDLNSSATKLKKEEVESIPEYSRLEL